MSASNITTRWSDFGSSANSSTSTSHRSISISPSLFLTVSQAKLHTFATDLLYPSSSVPTSPKDSSELLRRGLLISNAMDAAKKQMKIERKASYDEARYTKRNTSSRGHLRGSSRSASSSSHSMPSPIARQPDVAATGSVRAPNVANALDAEEGEEWFEETWRELMDEDERDASFSNTFKSSSSTSITVRTEYQEYTTTTGGSEQVYYTNGDASKFHTEVQVLPVDMEKESPSVSPESSRSNSPVSSDGSDSSNAELIGIQYMEPIFMPSQLLGISTFPWNEDTDVTELSIGDAEPYEHADLDNSVHLARSDVSTSPLKPRLLPTIIRDKFYEPSRFETEVDEDFALATLAATTTPTSMITLDDFMSMENAEIVYGSSPCGSFSSESEDDDELDEVHTPEDNASDDFETTTGYSSLSGASSSSSLEDTSYTENYFAVGYNPVSKASFSMSDAEWETMGMEIPSFS
ncbi:hypothetical protein QFC24_000385 [Naganishia onofrii]|uniref:Uncharacterized protein n=1 Tax=Naganishia onofrii TaxID=1851511 RepID=A0ACC2XVS6_9TREE|nr:hypothetical protein QFC24_000385 [Naganishia onofrii]